MGDFFERASVHLVRLSRPGSAGCVKIKESTDPLYGLGTKKLGGADVTNPAARAQGALIR